MIMILCEGGSVKADFSGTDLTEELFALILVLMHKLAEEEPLKNARAKLFAAIATYCHAPETDTDDFIDLISEGEI